MGSQRKSSIATAGELLRFCICAGLWMLIIASYMVGYDARPVTRREALSMINSRQIKNYGVRGNQILMQCNDGKWLSLDHFDNRDVFRDLGAQGAWYVYFDYWH